MSAIYRPDSSLFTARKLGVLAAKQEEKLRRLAPQETQYIPEEESSSHIGDLVDIAQSSGIREVGLVADFSKNAANYSLGSDLDSSEASGYSNLQTADDFAGMREGVREKLQEDTQKVYDNVALRDYGKALMESLNVATRVGADSAGSILGGLAGTALTGGLGGLNTVKRAYDAFDSISDKYKKTKKTLEVAGKVGKVAAGASVMSAVQTQRLVHQYQKENNGEMPSNQRLLGMGVGSLITETADLAIFKGLFLPKGKAKLDQAKSFVAAMKPDKKTIAAIASKLRQGSLKIGKVAGAEGVQEYFQTWHEILSTKVDPESGQSLWDAVQKEIGKKENKDEAITGGFLGAAGGGATKAAITTPGTAVGVAKDATVGAVKTAYKTVNSATQYVFNKSARKKLSEQEKVDLNREFAAQSEVVKQDNTRLKENSGIVSKASTVEDLLSNKDIAPVLKRVQATQGFSDEDLQNPKIFNAIKEGLTIAYSEDQKTLNKVLKDSNLSHFKRRSGSVSKNPAPTPKAEEVSTAIDNVKAKITKAFTTTDKEGNTKVDVAGISKVSSKVSKTIEELESPLALNTIKRATIDGDTVSGRVMRQASKLSVHDLERTAAIVQHTNPNAAKALLKLAKKKQSAIRRFTPSKSKIIDDSNIPEELTAVAEKGSIKESDIPSISLVISSVMHKKIKGAKAINAIQKTIESYEKTETFKKQGKGAIHTNTLAKWKKRLSSMAKVPEKESKPSEEVVPEKSTTESNSKEEVTATTKDEKVVKPEAKEKTKALTALTESLVSEGKVEEALAVIPTIVKSLKKSGYTTKEDLDNFLKEFPTLSGNEETANLLKLLMYDENVDEETEVVLEDTTTEEAKAIYTKLFPGCKP